MWGGGGGGGVKTSSGRPGLRDNDGAGALCGGPVPRPAGLQTAPRRPEGDGRRRALWGRTAPPPPPPGGPGGAQHAVSERYPPQGPYGSLALCH